MTKPAATSIPRAPDHLSPEAAAWWDGIVAEYALESHYLKLLQATAEAWDRLQQARETLARDGLTVVTADGGMKAHPCVAIERDARIAFFRGVREMDLGVDQPAEAPRPPAVRK